MTHLTNVEKWFTLLFFSLRKNSFIPVAHSLFCLHPSFPVRAAYIPMSSPHICINEFQSSVHVPIICVLICIIFTWVLVHFPLPVLSGWTVSFSLLHPCLPLSSSIKLLLSLSFCWFHVLTRPYFPPLSDETSLKSRLSQQRHDSEGMVAGYLSVERWGFSDRPKSINQTLKLAFFLVSEYVYHSNTIVNVHQQ